MRRRKSRLTKLFLLSFRAPDAVIYRLTALLLCAALLVAAQQDFLVAIGSASGRRFALAGIPSTGMPLVRNGAFNLRNVGIGMRITLRFCFEQLVSHGVSNPDRLI